MALKAEKGTFQSPGGTGNQTTTLSDVSFGTVKALLLWTVANNGDSDTDGNGIMTIGFGTYRGGTPAMFCTNYFDLDGAANSACAKGMTNASILHWLSAATPTVDADAALVSLGDHQFVVNWTDIPGGVVTVHYLALGGDDITDALCISPTLTTGAGTLDITVDTGFGKPDLLFGLACRNTTTNADVASAGVLAFGCGFDDGNEDHTSMATNTSSASMTMGQDQDTSFIGLMNNATSLLWEIELSAKSAWPTDGFRVNKLTAPPANAMFGVLALKGPFSKAMIAGSSQTAPASVTQRFHLGYAPRAAIFHHGAVPAKLGAIDSTSADLDSFSFGASDGTNQASLGVGNDNGNGTSIAHRNSNSSHAVRFLAPTAAGTPVLSEASCSFSGTDVLLTYSAADTLQREFRGMILGDAQGTPIAWTTA